MYVIQGLKLETMFDTEHGKEMKEVKFDTYDEAAKALESLERSLPVGHFKIVATVCGRCNRDDDVAIIHVDGEPKALCQKCRAEIFGRKKAVGRPSLGITKKVSVTLSEADWAWVDQKAEGNRSAFIRQALWDSLSNESEWSNNACLGYAIKGLENLNYSEAEIEKIVRAVYATFDMTSVADAKKIYENSPY